MNITKRVESVAKALFFRPIAVTTAERDDAIWAVANKDRWIRKAQRLIATDPELRDPHHLMDWPVKLIIIFTSLAAALSAASRFLPDK